MNCQGQELRVGPWCAFRPQGFDLLLFVKHERQSNREQMEDSNIAREFSDKTGEERMPDLMTPQVPISDPRSESPWTCASVLSCCLIADMNGAFDGLPRW